MRVFWPERPSVPISPLCHIKKVLRRKQFLGYRDTSYWLILSLHFNQLFPCSQLNSVLPPLNSFSCHQNGPVFCVSISVDGIIICSLAPNSIFSHLWLLPPLQVLKSGTSNSEIWLIFSLLLSIFIAFSIVQASPTSSGGWHSRSINKIWNYHHSSAINSIRQLAYCLKHYNLIDLSQFSTINIDPMIKNSLKKLMIHILFLVILCRQTYKDN